MSLLKKACTQGFIAEFKINIGNLYSKSLHGRLRKSATKPQRQWILREQIRNKFTTFVVIVKADLSCLLNVSHLWLKRNCFAKAAAARSCVYTAVSRKVDGKSARDNPERYCGWFLDHWFSKKFQRMAKRPWTYVLKESNKSRFDSYSVRNKCIGDISYYLSGLSRAEFLRQPFSK